MLSLFRTNQIAFNLLLIVYILLMRGSSFFIEIPKIDFSGQGVLSDWINGHWGTTGTVAVAVGIIIVFLQSLLINIIVAKFRIANSVTLFPGLIYILLVSLIPEFLALSPVLMANTFFILALWELLETYRKNNIAGHIVNTGFWLGLASLFYFPYVIFIFLIFIGLNVFRSFKIKELMMMVIGFIIPYIMASVYFFWTDQLMFFLETYVVGHFSFLGFHLKLDLIAYIKLAVIGLLMLVAMFSITSYYAKKNIQAQKNITVLLWALFIAAFSFLFQNKVQFPHFLIIMVPLSILLSFNFLKLRPQSAEVFHLLLFFGVLIWQFNPLWI